MKIRLSPCEGTAASAEAFPAAEVERARRYHRPRYLALGADLALAAGVLATLAFSGLGHALADALAGGALARALVLAAVVLAASALVRLPLAFWRGHLHERAFGLSTQSAAAWVADWAKGLAVSLLLGCSALVALVGLARALPGAWPAIAAPGAALVLLGLGFLAPLLLEPLFNRFEPLPDGELAAGLRALAERAGVPVKEVLVADASRRTRKTNAYVSGLGASRRVVLFDTMLEGGEPEEIRFVIAHELAHRRHRDVVKGTLLGMAGAAGSVLVLWGLLSSGGVLEAIDATRAGDPRVVPFVALVALGLEVLGLPLQAALSRRFERAADRFALELTGDRAALERAFRRLSAANLADLDPPRPVYLLLHTHPTIPERIAAARAQP